MPDAAGQATLNVAEMRKKIRAIGVEITPENLGAAMKLYKQYHPARALSRRQGHARHRLRA